MHTLHSRSRFIFCASLIVTLLLGSEFVYGRHALKKRQLPSHSNSNWKYYDSYPYASRQTNNQSSSGNRLYPTLDFTNPGQIDPGFSPHYHMRLNGTYIPNFNWGNGNVNPNNRYPPVINPNNRYPPVNRYPNGNYSNFNLHNPQDNQLPVGLVSQNNLPISRSTCGKTLCSYVANYPTKEIGNAVERAREVLRSRNANSLTNKGLSLETFTSKRNIGSNVSPGNRGPNQSSSCRANTNSIYPHEGFSSDDNQAYYIVNVPSLAQTVNSVECDSKNSQTCSQGVGRPTSGIKTCQQAYKKEQLLAVPFGKNYIDVNDFQLKTFHVPAGCYCLWASRPY